MREDVGNYFVRYKGESVNFALSVHKGFETLNDAYEYLLKTPCAKSFVVHKSDMSIASCGVVLGGRVILNDISDELAA